jgi:branched-chain amino acid transport system substrate-binding protein
VKRYFCLTAILLVTILMVIFMTSCAGAAPTTQAPASTTVAPVPPPSSTSVPPPPAAAPVSQTLKIGVIVSITGPVAPGLKSMYDAIKPTQDLLNQMGGITVNGQKYNIEYNVQDDKSSPPDGVAAINRLIQDQVKFLIAPIVPPIGLAIAPICEQAKILRVNPSQPEASFYGKENPHYFNAWMSSYDIPATYDFLVKHYPNVKK